VIYDDALIDGNGERVLWASDAIVPHIRRGSGRVSMLVAAAPDMELLLREVETLDDGYRCPWCAGEREDGTVAHTPDCRLGRVLARIDAAGKAGT
jgi:hypothetical protein